MYIYIVGTYTICGTPDYMSPEMLTNSGYNYSVDVWAVGVLIFEMSCGYAPFSENFNTCSNHSTSNGIKHNAATTMKNIMHSNMLIPQLLWDDPNDPDHTTIRMMRSLLVKNPTNRLGCVGNTGIAKLFQHSFFNNIDQNDLHQRRIKSPGRPTLDQGEHGVVEPSEAYQWAFNVQPYDGNQDYFEEW